MYAGCGRAGDYAGDPLLTLGSGYATWLNVGKTTLRVTFSLAGGLPASNWITYRNGAVLARGASSPADIAAVSAGVFPTLAAVATPAALDQTGYDPLGGRVVANITRLRTLYRHLLRGQYRMEDTSLDQYELYLGIDGDPDFTAAPYQTSATLPFTTAALAAGHTYKFVLRKRNKHNLVSQNVDATVFVIDGTGASVTPPSAPYEQILASGAAGAAHVTAKYNYLPDQDAGISGDTWAVWITATGVAPNPAIDPPTYTEPMIFADGECKLDYTDGGHAHGSSLKAIVRVRRSGTPTVDSTNATILTATSDATGPAAPVNAGAFLGEVAKQG